MQFGQADELSSGCTGFVDQVDEQRRIAKLTPTLNKHPA
jgi:hypothetical protein